MAIIVRDIKKPSSCSKCPFLQANHALTEYWCGISNRLIWYGWNEVPQLNRHKTCPISSELPEEHGDLVDKDEIRKMLKTAVNCCDVGEYVATSAIGFVNSAHVVVKATGKETS